MTKPSLLTQQYFLGIDGGGTKCKAVLTDNNLNVLGIGLAGSGNVYFGVEKALNEVMNAAQIALDEANIPNLVLSDIIAGIGLAGVNLPSLYQQVLSQPFPFKTLCLTTDLAIANLGAHQGNDGALIILGTGSCGFSSYKNENLIIGGHGFPHGDIASGAWLGFKAVEKVLLALEGMLENTLLTKLILQHYKVKTALALVEKISGQSSCFYGELASLVIQAAQQNDSVAVAIQQEAITYVERLAKRLLLNPAQPLAFIGGISGALIPLLSAKIQSRIQKAKQPPEIGAVLFAQQNIAQKKFTQQQITEQETASKENANV